MDYKFTEIEPRWQKYWREHGTYHVACALWNGVAPEEERMKQIGEIIGIDDITTLKPFCIITVGYPADGWENKFMDKFDEKRIHYEKY